MRFEKVACDRCKSEIDMTIPHERKIWLSGKGREGGLDLCDECYNEMFKWFMQFHTDDDCPNTLCKEVKDISFCMDCVSYRHCEAVFMWIIKTMVKSYGDDTKEESDG